MAVKQPQYPARIDWSKSITRGLVEAALPVGGGFDAITGLQLSTSGTVAREVGPFGWVSRYTDPNTGYRFRNSARLTSLDECTILCFSALDVAPGAIINGFAGYGNSADNDPLFLLGTNLAGTQLFFRCRDSAGTSQNVFAITSDMAIGKFNVFLGVRSVQAGTQSVYSNGALLTSDALTSVGAVSFDRFAIGGVLRSAFGMQLASRTGLVLMWNRALSAAEIKRVSANPWLVFKAPVRQMWLLPEAKAFGAFAPVPLLAPEATSTAGADTSAALASVLLLAPEATADITAIATGDLASVALIAPSATSTAGASTSSDLASVVLIAPTATADFGVNASGSLNRVILIEPNAVVETGTEAVGDLAPVILAAPEATGEVSAVAVGDLAPVPLVRPTATAAAGAVASAGVNDVQLAAPSATSTAGTLATGAFDAVSLAAPSATAAPATHASGAFDAVSLAAPSATAAEGANVIVDSIRDISLQFPDALAVAGAHASGAFVRINLRRPTGTSIAGAHGVAGFDPVALSPPDAKAGLGVLAAFEPIILSSPSGIATAFVLGAIAPVSLFPPGATSTAGARGVCSLDAVSLRAPAATARAVMPEPPPGYTTCLPKRRYRTCL